MLNPRQNMEMDMLCILEKIVHHEDISQLNQEQMFALYECVKNEYITGIKIAIMASGRIVYDSINPKVTKKGLEFLYPKELIQKEQNQDKPAKAQYTESHKPSGKKFYQSSIFWSAIAVMVTLLLWFIDRFFPR